MDYFDKNGEPITEKEASKLLADDSYTVIDRTVIGSIFVVTHWIAVDQDQFTPGAQNIFLTTIFDPTFDETIEDALPASTLDEARARHQEAIATVVARAKADTRTFATL